MWYLQLSLKLILKLTWYEEMPEVTQTVHSAPHGTHSGQSPPARTPIRDSPIET